MNTSLLSKTSVPAVIIEEETKEEEVEVARFCMSVAAAA